MSKSGGSLLSDILKVVFIFFLAMVLLAFAAFSVIKLSIRGNEVEVPNVIGRSFLDAFDILAKQGLQVRKMDERKYSLDLPVDYVVEQRPLPKSKVKKGREISLFLSRGTETGTVPRLIGQTVSDAESRLKSAGLAVGNVVKVHSDDFPRAGMVIAHTPPPNASVQLDSKVNLLVSLGSLSAQLKMPELGGMKLQDALKKLESLGLKRGHIIRKASPVVKEADVVLEQIPLSGDAVAKGGSVDLVVSLAQEASAKTSRIVFLRYQVPKRPVVSEDTQQEDLSPRYVKIVVEDESGIRVVQDGMLKPEQTKVYPLSILGKGIAKIYLDNSKWPVETRKL